MASTDARPVPRKNTAYRYYFAIRKNDGTLITTWAGQDSEVSLDGAAFSDCTNEATEIGTTGVGYIDLTSSEMNADAVCYKLTVTNTSALPIVVTFFPEEVGDYRANVEQFGGSAGTFAGGRPEVNTTHAAGTAWASGAITAAVLAADAITAAKVAADVTTEIQSGLATAAALTTVAGYIDTEIAAIITTLGTPAGASLSADIAAIEAQTDDIGAAGAGLSAVPWNAAWDAEVQSEVADALTAYDPPTSAELDARTLLAADYATAAALTTVDGKLPAALVGGRMDATIDATGMEAGAIDAILDDPIGDGSITLRQALRVLVAGMAGKLSGAETTTVTIRNLADSANVVVATVDADGNRTAVTVTP
jgi:hypothetical protein